MKTLIIAVVVILTLIAGVACATPGPRMVAPHTAAWDREADAKVTGYYLYYRAQGTTSWLDSQKSAIVPQPVAGTVPTLDLLTVMSIPGAYEIAVTAIDAAGDESGVSNIVPFVLYVPGSPANALLK